jgi:hypothetical protein
LCSNARSKRLASHFRVDGDWVFWQEDGRLERLRQDADALPLTDIRITGLGIS